MDRFQLGPHQPEWRRKRRGSQKVRRWLKKQARRWFRHRGKQDPENGIPWNKRFKGYD